MEAVRLHSRESLTPAGRSSAKLSLPALRSKMKCDPEGYESELLLVYSQFNSSVALFEQQAAMSFISLSGVASDPSVAKGLADRAMFLAQLTPFYPTHLSEFPKELLHLLSSSARSLPSSLRYHLAQALIFLSNRKILDIGETLPLFMELQTAGGDALKRLAFSHVIHTIRRMNQKHKDESKNRKLQNVMFSMLQQEDEAIAKRALATLCDLHRRKVWIDDRTANAICTACFHPSSRIMKAALEFLLNYEKASDDGDSDGSSSEDDGNAQKEHTLLSKEAVYKAHHKGTVASKKKKKAKLQRAMRSMKKQQRLWSDNRISNSYSPLNHLRDAQGYVEKLFSRLQTRNEPFVVKMMMLRAISRAIALHRLVLLNFYPFLQKYIQPHQRDVTTVLAAAADACHSMVPPDVVEPLLRQIVNQFIHEGSHPEAISVGLNVVREISDRMPLIMTEELLQDLVQYKSKHEKSVSIAARSLITLFREKWPELLSRKDRGRLTNPKARPKLFGEETVACDVPGVELLQGDDDINCSDENNGNDQVSGDSISGESDGGDSEVALDDELQEGDDSESEDEVTEAEEGSDYSDTEDDSVTDDVVNEDEEDEMEEENDSDEGDIEGHNRITDVKSSARKRKFSNIDFTQTSMRALKKAVVEKTGHPSENAFYSDEVHQEIKAKQAEANVKVALARHGLLRKGSRASKIYNSDELSLKRVDPAMLETNVRKKLSKEEKLKLVREGREDRGKYQARTALKKKKTGGLSNRQKEHKKTMPLAAKRLKVARAREEKKKKRQRGAKQFRGRKAWK